MKLDASIVLVLAVLLAVPLAAAPAAPALAGLPLSALLSTAACGASADAPAFQPVPAASDPPPILCGNPCSAFTCQGRPVGSFCGIDRPQYCVAGLACSSGQVYCRCE